MTGNSIKGKSRVSTWVRVELLLLLPNLPSSRPGLCRVVPPQVGGRTVDAVEQTVRIR